jgi:hypothetical protein
MGATACEVTAADAEVPGMEAQAPSVVSDNAITLEAMALDLSIRNLRVLLASFLDRELEVETAPRRRDLLHGVCEDICQAADDRQRGLK